MAKRYQYALQYIFFKTAPFDRDYAEFLLNVLYKR